MNKKYFINTLDLTRSAAIGVANQLRPGSVLFLYGEVGIGKSTFTTFILEYFGFQYEGSPTFGLVNLYKNDAISIAHADCYREAGILKEILLLEADILIIEWPDKNISDFFKKSTNIHFKFHENDRIIEVENVL